MAYNLKQNAESIRDTTTKGANTAERVGEWMVEASDGVAAAATKTEVAQELTAYAKTNDTTGKVIRDAELAQTAGADAKKAVSQKLFTEQINAANKEIDKKADTTNASGTVIRNGELAQTVGTDAKKAVSQKIFTELINKRANGGKFDGGFLQLTCDGTNVGNPIELGGLGIINVTEDNKGKTFATANEARTLVKNEYRITGQLISYHSTTLGWVLEMFTGDNVGSWLDNAQWKQYLTADKIEHLDLAVNDLQTQLNGIDDDIRRKADDSYIDQEDEETAYLVLTSNGEEISRTELPKLGGGGGGTGVLGVVMKLRAVDGTSIVAGEGADAYIKWNFTSIDQEDGGDTGSGTMVIYVDGLPVFQGAVNQGEGVFNVRNYIKLGRNNVKLRIEDSYNNARSISYTVQKASLVLTSPFSADNVYIEEPVSFRYVVTGSGNKTIRFWLNDTEMQSENTSTSGIQLTKQLTGLKAGINKIRVQATSVLEGSLLTSNELYYEFLYARDGVGETVILSSFNQTTVKQFETLQIPYFAYNPTSNLARVFLYADNELVESLDVPRSMQVWEYRVTQPSTLKLELRCGSSSKIFDIAVQTSELGIQEVLGDLAFRVKAVGKSNSSENKNVWSYGNYKTNFNKFNWNEDGWKKDKENSTALKLVGDAEIEINTRPFNTSVVTQGLTYTIEFSTEDVVDDDAVIIEQFLDGVGIKITPTEIFLRSAESGLSRKLDSAKKVSVSFVIRKRTSIRMMELYINGILSGAVQYSQTDSFSHSGIDLKASTGGRNAIVYLYTIRWYRNDLTDEQILGNFIYDTEVSSVQEEIYKRNDIIDDYNSIDQDKASNSIPILLIVGELPDFKGDIKTVTIIYIDRLNPDKSFIANKSTIDVQGTSSTNYPLKNFKFKFDKTEGVVNTETNVKSLKYALKNTGIATDVFCTKLDFVDSSSVNNTGLAVIVNELLKTANILTPAQIANKEVRNSIYGFPTIMFQKLNETAESKFIGKYNFNHDKGSKEVFGFEEGVESWEHRDNTSDLCLFRGADFDSTYVNDKGVTLFSWTQHIEPRYPSDNMDIVNLRKMYNWVISCKSNPVKFKQELKNYWDVDNVLSYWVITEHFGCIDQRAKNQFPTMFKDGKWRFMFYDAANIMGIDDSGLLNFNYDIESTDSMPGGFIYNGADSEFWKLVVSAFAVELAEMYIRLRKGKLTLDYALSIFQDHQSDMWVERVYNKDSLVRYVDPLVNQNKNFLAQLQGSRTSQRIWWLKNRFQYMDSRFNTGSYRDDFVFMRMYKPTNANIAPQFDFTLTTNKAGYVHIKFGQSESNQTRAKKGVPFKVMAPTSMQFNDTETIIFGASALKDLGEVYAKYIGLIDVSDAIRLERLIIGNTAANYSNPNFKNLELGNNTLIKEIQTANCPNFGNVAEGSTSASLDLSKMLSLEIFNASKTALKAVQFPQSGTVKRITLPATITTLTLKDQTALESFNLEGKSNIQLLHIENTPIVNGYALAKEIIAANYANPALRTIRLIDINVNDADDSYITKIAAMHGIDDNGDIVEGRPTITGKAYFATMTKFGYDYAKAQLPNLDISYGKLIDQLSFSSPEIEELALATYDSTKKGYLTSEDVGNRVWTPSLANLKENAIFNELRYFMGGTAIINGPLKITGISIGADNIRRNATINGMPNLIRVMLEDKGENLFDPPKIEFYSFGNCLEISDVDIYGNGRYSVARGLNCIMAKQTLITGFDVDTMIYPIRNKIGSSFILESSRELPLYISLVPSNSNDSFGNNQINLTHSRLNYITSYNFKNIYRFYMNHEMKGIKNITIDGICRTPYITNAERYSHIQFSGHTTNPNDKNYGTIKIGGDTSVDGTLHSVVLDTFGCKLLEINAKCTPDDYLSRCYYGGTSGQNPQRTVVFGEHYMPGLITSYKEYQYDSGGLRNDLVIKAKTFNGQPYIPTCDVKEKLYHSQAPDKYQCVIRNLYVPDENIELYKADTAWVSAVVRILPLSSFVG